MSSCKFLACPRSISHTHHFFPPVGPEYKDQDSFRAHAFQIFFGSYRNGMFIWPRGIVDLLPSSAWLSMYAAPAYHFFFGGLR